jgi:hypothetical protein
MAEKKSILEEALLDIKNIEGALNANTKEILRSVAKEEIDSVVKESIMDEADFEEEDIEAPETPEMGGDDMGAQMGTDIDGLDDIEGSDEVGTGMDSDMGMNTDVLGGDDMDMTASTDDDVIAIYKKLSGEDEIEIIGDEIHLNVSEPGEYVVKMNNKGASAGIEDFDDEEDSEELDLDGLGDDDSEELDLDGMGDDEDEDEDEADYEIEMGDEEEDEDEESEESEESEEEDEEFEDEEEEELEEQISQNQKMENSAGGQLTDIKGPGARRFKEKKTLEESVAAKKLVLETTKKYNSLLTEAKSLKTENEQFRAALKEFRTKLVETVVFNSNLTYVTRILMEHSTTKAEKQAIIKRFDEEVSNLKESKNLYKSIVNGLASRKPINESVQSKIIKEVSTGSSKQLNESTAYVDPSTKRIMDLINRVEKR